MPAHSQILLVEDNPDIREPLAWLLTADGYAVEEAEHGQQALEKLRQGLRPDLIFLDLMMPVMDGVEFCERLRDEPELADIPVVVLSATADEETVSRLGVEEALTKPPDVLLLESLADRYASRRQAGAAAHAPA